MHLREGRVAWLVALYVDDMSVAASSASDVIAVKQGLSRHFKVNDLGAARFVLGMEVRYNREQGQLSLSQRQFVLRLCRKFNQTSAADVYNPAQVRADLVVAASDSPTAQAMSPRPYRSLIRSLMYVATTTRPDVAFIVALLSRHLDSPTTSHWKSANCVLRYLKTTQILGIHYRASRGNLLVEAFSDSDCASSKDTRMSVSGALVIINGGPVIFKSSQQRTVALGSAEAEQMALSACAEEIVWLRNLLFELGYPVSTATTVKLDNQSAIAIATNIGYQSRAKHIDIRHHFVRDHVESGTVKLEYVPTKF